jgi:hypothetical protein
MYSARITPSFTPAIACAASPSSTTSQRTRACRKDQSYQYKSVSLAEKMPFLQKSVIWRGPAIQ